MATLPARDPAGKVVKQSPEGTAGPGTVSIYAQGHFSRGDQGTRSGVLLGRDDGSGGHPQLQGAASQALSSAGCSSLLPEFLPKVYHLINFLQIY